MNDGRSAMLRDFCQRPYLRLLQDVLDKFAIEDEPEEQNIVLLRFEVLSPDAFMWRLKVGEHLYYVYAEDYVSSLDSVKDTFQNYLSSDRWTMVTALRPAAANETSSWPGSHPATTKGHTVPTDADDIVKYMVISGLDKVFLACSQEDPSDALFAANAPSGFTQRAINPEVAGQVMVSQIVNAIKSARLRAGLGPGQTARVVIQGIAPESELANLVQAARADILYQTRATKLKLGDIATDQPTFSRVGGIELLLDVAAD